MKVGVSTSLHILYELHLFWTSLLRALVHSLSLTPAPSSAPPLDKVYNRDNREKVLRDEQEAKRKEDEARAKHEQVRMVPSPPLARALSRAVAS